MKNFELLIKIESVISKYCNKYIIQKKMPQVVSSTLSNGAEPVVDGNRSKTGDCDAYAVRDGGSAHTELDVLAIRLHKRGDNESLSTTRTRMCHLQ